KAYGVTQVWRDRFLTELLHKHTACLDQGRKKSEEVSEKLLNACFRGSVRELASTLGHLEFTRRAKKYIENPQELSTRFDQAFLVCLEEKKEAKIKDYVSHIDVCWSLLTRHLTG